MIVGNDLTTRAIEWALHGLDRRSNAIANNIANAEVPNFRASSVDFEDQLRGALNGGRISRIAEPTVRTSTETPGPNGNNVRLENELVNMIENNLNQSAMVEAFNYKAGLLRIAMRGQ